MNARVPQLPTGLSERIRWSLSDSAAISGRALAHWARQPGQVIVGLLFPVLLIVMMGYLLGGQMRLPGGEDYFEFLVPGVLALGMLFGVEATMISVTTDASRGVTDRFRALPIARSAVLLGRSAADMLNSAAGLVVMIAAGLVVGWSVNDGLANAATAIVLMLLLRFAMIWVGIFLGLVAKSPESVVAVQILVWPLGFLSNAFVSPESMPGVVGTIAEWNPLSSTAAAVRELFGNPGWGGDSWVAQHAELMAVAWPLALVAVFVPLSVRRWRDLGR